VRLEGDFEYSDEYRLLALKQFVIDAVLSYPWDATLERSEVMAHGNVAIEDDNALTVILGGPPSVVKRIPVRLAARVIFTHINNTFQMQVPLPATMYGDLDLTRRPLQMVLPPTPAHVVDLASGAPTPVSRPPTLATAAEELPPPAMDGGGSSSSMVPRTLFSQDS
jgi:hypothetical protein